jgi:predicted nucleic acid-binding Zn ribbon protein
VAQPRKIGDVLAQLIARRGYAREQSSAALEATWQEAAGEQVGAITRVGTLRRGTLEVLVSNNLLAQELGFQKEGLIARLQKLSPQANITQLRFRVGNIS